jgi:hypothetical protein
VAKSLMNQIMNVFEPVTFYINQNGTRLEVKAIPYNEPAKQDVPLRFQIVIGQTPYGEIERKADKWESIDIQQGTLLDAIISNILKYYK